MKFLCDRCKTRYSIGDDRVRGKILKIRCKNCGNVITVREGMPAPTAADMQRTKEPSRQPVAAAPAGALGAAFASQLAKPPPALEEEWYVSIDGQQAGPFTLADAQRWVASKPFSAELHCWSEGFDDWLPVDKVSHFRGLRKPPAQKRPTIPPPIPAPAPKPLFASTMASIEKAASERHTLPPVSRQAPEPLQPMMQARANGAPALPSVTRPSGPAARPGLPSPVRAPTAQGIQPFKADDGATVAEAPAFEDEYPPTADPANQRLASAVTAARASIARDVPPALNATVQVPLIDDDDLEIGEVSRVVNLADLARTKPKAPAPAPLSPGARPSGNLTGSGRLTSSHPRLSPTELGMNVDPMLAPAGVAPDESVVAQSFAARHRRGMIFLIAASAVMVLGVIILVGVVVTKNTDELSGTLGGSRVIDTSRPEEIVRKQAGLPPTPVTGTTPIKPRYRPTQHIQQPNVEEPDTGGNKLDASEIETMAQKQNEGTKRCYLRAQKGAISYEIAELKKIDVTLTVNKDGSVGDVNLSSHAGDTFGQCLIARIKSWKFRESRGGTFRIALAFGSG